MASFSRSATLEWTGDVARGQGRVDAASGAFGAAATFPRVAGESAGATTPEELLAASHATCFGIGLRSVLAQRGASAHRVSATATITAQKDSDGIRVVAAHLEGVVEGLAGLDAGALAEVAQAAEQACTISILLRPSVAITVSVRADDAP